MTIAKQTPAQHHPGNMMKAFIVDRYGSKNGLRLGEVPIPEPREDEVLVQVHAAGVNLLDTKVTSGEFKLILPYRLPFVMGHDVAGVVVKVGRTIFELAPSPSTSRFEKVR